MPGFIGNYRLKHTGRGDAENNEIFNTLACKLVTSFSSNKNLSPPKPSIIGNINIFSDETGELRAIVQATEITAWRTASASIVSTDYLYLRRPGIQRDAPKEVAIIGCGVQVHFSQPMNRMAINSILTFYRDESMRLACARLITCQRFICGIGQRNGPTPWLRN